MSAGNENRTRTGLLPRDFKSERAPVHCNDLQPDHSADVPPASTAVHTTKEAAVTPAVTRQYAEKRDRVHQAAYHKQYAKTERGRAALKAASKRWNERHPEKIKAHRTVGYAVRRGTLVKGPCELADANCKGRIEAHHQDYAKPLEVRWVCKAHHRLLDYERRGRGMSLLPASRDPPRE